MNHIEAIEKTIHDYFMGTYHGDIAQIQATFSPDAQITGYIQEKYFNLSLPQFIERQKNAPAPITQGEMYDKKIILIDVSDNVAVVKTLALIRGLVFTDYLTLVKINQKWLIQHKSFTT